tara:strand:+ start:136 stop:558 length:423 start_codon:yes stop_codon:yes gene_type:complete
MANLIVLLHEKSLRIPNTIVDRIKKDTKVVFVWDDEYYKNRGYSLKRLVFIYETISKLPVQILRGDTLQILTSCNPKKVLIPFTADTGLTRLSQSLSRSFNVEIIKDDLFCEEDLSFKTKRFFKYWKKAEKTVFFRDGKK